MSIISTGVGRTSMVHCFLEFPVGLAYMYVVDQARLFGPPHARPDVPEEGAVNTHWTLQRVKASNLTREACVDTK